MIKPNIPLEFFPLSIASGNAFCNRVAETAQLQLYINQQRPVLLVSPRRYGKTSLALHAIHQSQLPFAHIDFFSAVEENDVEHAILQGIGKLIARIEPIPKRALSIATELFSGSQIRVALSAVGFSLEVNQKRDKPAHHVLDILERLEKLALRYQQKIILFFDEFQCLGEITANQAIESVLRQVAQKTKSLSFIFSGSNRRLLSQLFDDRKRPFYKLCERITLHRISSDDYLPHIQHVAQKTWADKLDDNTLAAILHYSDRHPYYVNLLCSRLLQQSKKPTVAVIEIVWQQYVKEERSSVAAEIDLLSKNQKKLLIVLARTNGTKAPLGQAFIQTANMSKATLGQSLTFLESHDYVSREQDGHTHVLDPLIKFVLAQGQELHLN